MTQRRDVDHRLTALGEIRGIMTSMKSLALMETHRLARYLETQRRVVSTLESAAADFVRFHPPPPAPTACNTCVLIGSERGFCGDFNERVLARYRQFAEGQTGDHRMIVVGRKLGLRLGDTAPVVTRLDGPMVAEEIPSVLARLVESLRQLQQAHGPLALNVLHQDADTLVPRALSVLPPFQALPPVPARGYPPQLQLDPDQLFGELVDHYLFAALHGLFYTSLMAENRQRIAHLEGALKRMDEELGQLTRQRNSLRQEEITEEIEVILLSSEAPAGE